MSFSSEKKQKAPRWSIARVCALVVLLPFALCVVFLRVLGRLFHLDYPSISVIFNLYIQGALLSLTGVLPFVVQLVRILDHFTPTQFLLLLVSLAYATFYLFGLYSLVRHYPPRMYASFERCVKDLRALAAQWHMSYMAVNLLIFVIWWLALVGVNLFLVSALWQGVM